MAAEAGTRITRILTQIRAAAQAGDWVICIDGGRDLNTQLAITLFDQMDGMAPGVVLRTIAGATPLAVADDWRILLAGLLRSARLPLPEHLVCLPGVAGDKCDGVSDLRAAILKHGADLVALVPTAEGKFGETDTVRAENVPPVLVRHVMRTRRFLDFDRRAAGDVKSARQSFGELDLLWRAGAAHPDLPRLGVAPGLLCPVPDAGARCAGEAADLLQTVPDAREWLTRSLPVRLASAPPGARALLRPRLAAMGLPVSAETFGPLPAPARNGRARLRVLLSGPHGHRTPLGWPALAPLFSDRIVMTQDPGLADIVVIGHPLDALALPRHATHALSQRDRPLVLLSEEPFWDGLFSPDPAALSVILPTAHIGEARAHQINHHRGRTFDFDRIPYYLLTDHGYWPAYAARFARGARRTVNDWAERFATRPPGPVFMAEKRPERFHDLTVPEAGIVGLCAWRTRLALACTGAARHGASWQGGPTRFEIENWHFDKLARLDEAVRDISALENTHQPTYVSEKLFDAFACGARPLYMAGPGHRALDIGGTPDRTEGLPEGSFLNLWGMGEASAAAAIAAPLPEGFFDTYAMAQRRLATLFSDLEVLAAERARLSRALWDDLRDVG